MKNIFEKINLTWPKIIIFAILIGLYTGIMCLIPATYETSFRDIAATFEVWILFGIFIIMNSKSNKDSALKCFVFFLISQPLVYLIQVPFSRMGWELFIYYKYWFIITLFTFPMGYIGYYLKREKWYSLLILTPILILLSFCYYTYLGETISFFPNHLLTVIFCFITLLLYPIVIFKNKTLRIIELVITIILIILASYVCLTNKRTYNTSILIKDIKLTDDYNVYLKDESFGKLKLEYNNNLEECVINATFTKIGDTEIVIETPDKEIISYKIHIQRYSYSIDYEESEKKD